ncbi:MAG: hypothetical protein JWO59_387 [Chloroflexi bacterium]|nr:hypothetical protein [Chloroflexota bacterium]
MSQNRPVNRDAETNMSINSATDQPAASDADTMSRRTMLQHSTTTAAGLLLAGALVTHGQGLAGVANAAASSTRGSADLQPRDAVSSVIAALDRYPLVALGERHLLQEMHDFYTTLLRHPALPGKLTDIVVEFGNVLHQDIADRFVLNGEPVGRDELSQIWRFTIGGGVYWDAPVYEQFFRTVRAVNWMRPPSRRIRVLLGDPPFDHRKVGGSADKSYVLSMKAQRDAHYAAVVEREVLRKGRRALLIAGGNHLLRGIHDQNTPPGPNAGTRLAQHHPGALYVVDLLVLPPGATQSPLVRRTKAIVANWPRPAIATLPGTWLGAETQSLEPWINSAAYLADTPASARYGAQADAILYLGPGEVLTASQADPGLYRWGAYPAELQRLSRIYTAGGAPTDYVAEGIGRSQAGPSWFAQFGSPTR